MAQGRDADRSASDLVDDLGRLRLTQSEFVFTPGCFGALLEHCSSDNDRLTMKLSQGECQDQHRTRRRYVPVLDNPQASGDYCTALLQRQHELIQQGYNPSTDGDMRLDVKIGWNYYFDEPPLQRPTVRQLYDAIARTQRGGGRGRGRGRGGRGGGQQSGLFRSSFKEADLNVDSVKKYLAKNNWIETKIDQYVLFFEPEGSDPKSPKRFEETVRILLHPNMDFKEIRRHGRKWLHMGYFRSNQENHDMRIEIHSVNNGTELTTSEKDLFLNRELIRREENGGAGDESIFIPTQPPSFGYEMSFIRNRKMSSFSPPNAGEDLKSKFLVLISEITSFSNLHPGSNKQSEKLTSVNLQFDHENFEVLDCIKDPKFLGTVSELADDIF